MTDFRELVARALRRGRTDGPAHTESTPSRFHNDFDDALKAANVTIEGGPTGVVLRGVGTGLLALAARAERRLMAQDKTIAALESRIAALEPDKS